MSIVTDSELQELFVAQLRHNLWSEKVLVTYLSRQAALAVDKHLRSAIEMHLKETEKHVSRLEKVFYLIDVAPRTKVCKAMEGLMEAGNEIVEGFKQSVALDAALICACQKIEHYEIATYGTLHAFSEELGLEDAGKLLVQTLIEEIGFDKRLSRIATTHANHAAVV